ncbi:hypothetical protein VCUG_00561 [Vavraia culicis subsp. floridensis]|uniref:Uncharacterized protein n=1 Tax=Vavraia culicis (isolate floridensis) TaxID=948595 RepID=L2GXH4_VAVCU|nr:uncharacterized protein VCUG_00561 [Vavraia culicis subsp. floridensis]ELA47978.1 hypothetical protein VCUG_00561 [Vavraia culicis subsp. floridensis]
MIRSSFKTTGCSGLFCATSEVENGIYRVDTCYMYTITQIRTINMLSNNSMDDQNDLWLSVLMDRFMSGCLTKKVYLSSQTAVSSKQIFLIRLNQPCHGLVHCIFR